jgi:hypothetical protein
MYWYDQEGTHLRKRTRPSLTSGPTTNPYEGRQGHNSFFLLHKKSVRKEEKYVEA